jgi:hypothetical protein
MGCLELPDIAVDSGVSIKVHVPVDVSEAELLAWR